MNVLLVLLLVIPSIVFGQTTNSRTQAGDGTPITDTTSGRLDVSVQNPVNAAQSGTWNVTNVSGTVSLPTGASTETTLGTRLAESTFTGRFPAAAALANDTANPTLSAIASYNMCYDGVTWDRCLNMSSDTDDNSIVSGLSTGLDISLNYAFDGTSWVRQRAFSSADNIAAQVGQFMHGGLMAWDSGGSNWDRLLLTSGALHVNVQNASLTVTANAGTNLNTSALALESGGNLATIAGVVDAIGTTVPANTLFVGGTDGTNTRALKTDSSGELQVDVLTLPTVTVGTFPDNEPFNVAQVNGSTVQVASNGLNTTGAGLQAQAMAGQCDDTSPTALTENQFGHARINCTTHHQLVEVGAALPTGSNTIGNVNPGTATNWGVYVEDNGETAGGNLSMSGTVRRDTAASSAGSTGDNATLNTDATGLLWTRTIDPCSSGAKTYLAINISSAATTEITPSLAGGSNHYYVCSLVLVTAAANNVALVDDDSDGCGSVTAGMAGGTTAASGFNLAANGGLTFGNGMGSVFKTNGTNRVVCLVTSASTQLSGTMTVVAAP